MLRKVVKHGANTLTVSLPSKWAKKNNIKQGDEINIEIKGNQLILAKSFQQSSEILDVDLTETNVMLPRIIASLYKCGYERVNIKYGTHEELEAIEDTIYRYCHVYEIIDIRKNIVHIKAISQLDPSHFRSIFKTAVQSSLTIARETLEAIKSKNYDELSNLISKDKIVDRYTAYGTRILNKGHNLNYRLIGPLYFVFEEIEISTDILKIISRELIKNRIVLSKPIMEFFEDVIELMELLFDIFLNFSLGKVKRLGLLETNIRKKISELCETQKKNIKVLAYLINLFQNVFEMKSAVMTLHFGDDVFEKEN